MRQEVFELHELLNAAGIRGPLVMVGHSIGGLLVRLYAERYADDVVGMVLVDPTHESEVLFNLPKNAWVRVRDLATDRIVPEPQLAPSEIQPGDDYLAEELQLIYLARKAAPVPLGDRPLVVLAAGRRPAPPGVSDERWNEMKVEKGGQRIDLSELSTNSKFVLDPASRHEIQSDDPPLVARAIEEVLDALATGRRLTP
jgi:pimeloyl-ACP methyl ester carboxylesterase